MFEILNFLTKYFIWIYSRTFEQDDNTCRCEILALHLKGSPRWHQSIYLRKQKRHSGKSRFGLFFPSKTPPWDFPQSTSKYIVGKTIEHTPSLHWKSVWNSTQIPVNRGKTHPILTKTRDLCGLYRECGYLMYIFLNGNMHPSDFIFLSIFFYH